MDTTFSLPLTICPSSGPSIRPVPVLQVLKAEKAAKKEAIKWLLKVLTAASCLVLLAGLAYVTYKYFSWVFTDAVFLDPKPWQARLFE